MIFSNLNSLKALQEILANSMALILIWMIVFGMNAQVGANSQGNHINAVTHNYEWLNYKNIVSIMLFLTLKDVRQKSLVLSIVKGCYIG